MINIYEIQKEITNVAIRAAATGVNHFTDSFKNQGFTNERIESWQPRKQVQLYRRRGVTSKKSSKLVMTKAGRRDNNRAILVKRGNLKRSIRGYASGMTCVFTSSLPYSQVHNEGSKTTPQRQYMGDSVVLRRKIEEDFHNTLSKYFNS